MKLWLIDKDFEKSKVIPWTMSSMVSGKLGSESYSPQIWWKNPALQAELASIKKPVSGQEKKAGNG